VRNHAHISLRSVSLETLLLDSGQRSPSLSGRCPQQFPNTCQEVALPIPKRVRLKVAEDTYQISALPHSNRTFTGNKWRRQQQRVGAPRWADAAIVVLRSRGSTQTSRHGSTEHVLEVPTHLASRSAVDNLDR